MTFDELYKINVNDKTENRDGLTYLSWAWAWAEFKKRYPEATYEVYRDPDTHLPYVRDPDTGYMVFTKVYAGGNTHEMWLPVMDGKNKAMKSEPYSYYVKNPNFKYATRQDDGRYRDKYGKEQKEYLEKEVPAANMFDVNKAIMRCLTKNLAMFGLGLYIYAGEDLPEGEAPQAGQAAQPTLTPQQRAAILHELTRTGISKASTAEAYGVNALEDIPAAAYDEIMGKLTAKPDRA